MAARRRKCLQVVDRFTSVFTGWTKALTSVCHAVGLQGQLSQTSSFLEPVTKISEPALQLVKRFRKSSSEFCEECSLQMTEMKNHGSCVDPPTKEEIEDDLVARAKRDIRERLILQALVHPEINEDKIFPRLVNGTQPIDAQSPRMSISHDYIHLRYPNISGITPIPGSHNYEMIGEQNDSGSDASESIDVDLKSNSVELLRDQASSSSSAEGLERQVEEEISPSLAGIVSNPPSHLWISRSFGYSRPTYNDTFGSFGVITMHSLPAKHLHYTDTEIDKGSPDFFTCREIISKSEKVPVPAKFAWEWLEPSIICFCQKDVIGRGIFSTVLFVHLAEYNSESVSLTGAVMKTFKAKINNVNHVLMEADMASYMASLGVGPSVIGLVKACPERELILPSLLYEYIPGTENLLSLFKGSSKPSRYQALDMLIQIARLLTVIHHHGFLHNDIKLDNVIAIPNPLRGKDRPQGVSFPPGAGGPLTTFSQYRVYLIDFGVSTYHGGARYATTHRDLEEFYRYPYIPPEVLMKGGPTSTASDVYSFGLLLQYASDYLGDDKLAFDLLPTIRQCTLDPSERPLMAIVERQLAAKMPKFPNRWRQKLHLPPGVVRSSILESELLPFQRGVSGNSMSTPVLPSS